MDTYFPNHLQKICKFCGKKDTFYYANIQCDCGNNIFHIFKSKPVLTVNEKKVLKEYRKVIGDFYKKNNLHEHCTCEQIKNGTCWNLFGDDNILVIKDAQNNIIDKIDISEYTKTLNKFGKEKL